jgi:formate hydrogenlyase subunit 4
MNAFLHLALALVLAPVIPGIVNRVKARVAGRAGKPILQTYFDLAKLLRKGAVVSHTASWVVWAGPLVSLAAVACALLLLPGPGLAAPVAFAGDFMFLAYLLGLSRLALVLAALDTGSSFEGMGASREAVFSTLAEPVLFLCFLSLAANNAGFSLSTMLVLPAHGPITAERLFVPAILFVLLLVENCRIPVDDPNTHLELTMIHEVMVLDHSGPDLAAVLYGASLKLWIFCALTALSLTPAGLSPLAAWGAFAVVMFVVAVVVGLVESSLARLRMGRVPRLLGGAGALVALSLVLSVWR